MRKFYKKIAILIAFVMVCFTGITAYASTITELEEQVEEAGIELRSASRNGLPMSGSDGFVN